MWSAFFTFVIAVATIAYVAFTQRLWKETKKAADAATVSANAARMSADAAKKDVEIQVALHRPYVGISRFWLTNTVNADPWAVTCEVRNYGLSPAEKTYANIKVILGSEVRKEITEPSQLEIFPGQIVSVSTNFPIPSQTRQVILDGARELWVRVRMGYMAAGGSRYEYSAQIQFMPALQGFIVTESHTEEIPS